MFLGNDILPATAGQAQPIWIPAPSAGGFTLLQSPTLTGVIGGTTSVVDTSGCNLIVVAVSNFNDSIALSDSKGNSYTGLTLQNQNGRSTQIFYCAAPVVGSGHTFTLSGGNYYGAQAYCLSGGHASPYHSENGQANGNSGSTIQPGAVTPAVNGSFIVASFSSIASNTNVSIDSGFTAITAGWDGSSHVQYCLGYLIQGTAGSVNPTFSGGSFGGGPVSVAIADFAPA